MKRTVLLVLAFAGIQLNAQQNPTEEEGPAHKAALQRMIDERGGEANMSRYADEMQQFRASAPSVLNANWSYIDASGNANGDVGRTNCVTLDTLNPGRFYVCTPHSGVWMTTNDGASYTPITEALPTQSASCLVIDPTNTNVLYLATGAHNMDMPANSLGVFKSIDGGLTWNSTGLTFAASALVTIGDLIMNPQDHNSLYAATTDGLYRTSNGGASWTRVVNDTIYSVRFKPGDTATVFAVGRRFYHTDDSWTNWALLLTTYRNSFTWKFEYSVRVSAATPNLVYLLTQGSNIGPGGGSFLHVSSDGGWSFSLIDSLYVTSCQFDVSQQTPYKYMLGYHGVFKRENTVSSLQQMTYGNPSQQPYVHVDQRGIMFDPRNDNIIYLCNDGGMKRSTDNGVTFQNLTANMQLAHLYNFGQSQTAAYKILPAPLDVSPYLIGPTGIYRTFPLAEAFIAAMSPVNDSVYMLGHFAPYFTNNDWTSSFQSSNPVLGNASNYPGSFQYSQTQEHINYHGSQGFVYTSTDFGASHTITSQLPWYANNTQYELDVSGTNPNYMYLRVGDSLYVSNGISNTNITAGLPLPGVRGTAVTIDPDNDQNVWITFSGYTAGEKVYFSNNAGQTWVNMSAGLPNIPVNDIVCQRNGVPGAVYCATDGGVFYRDSTFSSWQYFNTGLPNVIVTDLDIQYGIGKLRASTFGRGMWESDLYTPNSINETNIAASAISVYPNPATNSLHIQSATGALGKISVSDVAGRTLLEFSTTENAATIDISTFARGCYFLRVNDEVLRFVKQ